MKFIKNVILPLAIILMTTLIIVYNPMLKLGTILFMIVVSLSYGISIYPFYYIFRTMFPDDRNPETPPQITMLLKMRKKEPLNKEQMTIEKKTIAFKLTAISTSLFIFLGFYLWNILPEKYLNYQVSIDGVKTVGVIIASTSERNDIGDHKTYKFHDPSGNEYTNYVKDDNLNLGDSVNVLYSKHNPKIHKISKKF